MKLEKFKNALEVNKYIERLEKKLRTLMKNTNESPCIKIHASGSITLFALRYCFGRMSVSVSEYVDWLLCEWDKIDRNHQDLICREIRGAIASGIAVEKCDVEEWQKILSRADQERERRKS